MGILKSLFTLGKSFISQAEESIEETQGVRMLEEHGLRGAVMDAVIASYNKTKEMGKG